MFHQNSKYIHSLQTQGKPTDTPDNTSFLLALEQQDTKNKKKGKKR